jgi:hypothetical protein
MQYYLIGELQFTTNGRRNTGRTMLIADAVTAGLTSVPFPSWALSPTTGLADATIGSRASLRMAYVTNNQVIANSFVGGNFAEKYGLADGSWWSSVGAP